MRSIRILVLAMLALFAAPTIGQGPVPQPAGRDAAPAGAVAAQSGERGVALDAADLEAWLDGFLPYALDRGGIAGGVVVVVRGDGVVLQKGYGYSDVAARTPVSPDATLFRPGSVSKLIAWTAVMQQVEAGRLDLDRDVNAYLDFTIPAFDGKPITLRHIMTHTAGFEESIRMLITADPGKVMPLNEQMPKALPNRVFAPGTTPAYSNYATALAGYLVERVTGMTFDDYVDQRVFAPIGMTRSSFRQPLPAALQPLMSKGYTTANAKPKPFEIVIPAPAGSLSSTGADMGRFMMAHLNNGAGLLQPETARMMHEFRAPGIGPLNTMALGFYEQQVNGRRAISHGGDTQWFHSYLWLFPDADIGLYISLNSAGTGGATGAIRTALFHQFADRYLPGGDVDGRVDAETAREHARMMVGNYVSSRGAFTNFARLLGLLGQASISVDADGKLVVPFLPGLGTAPREWVEIAPFVWRDTATGERLAAEVRDGRVVRVSADNMSPFMVFEPVTFAFNAAWLLPATMLSLLIVLIAALAWPLGALVRRRYGATLALEGRARSVYRVTRGFAWAVVVAIVGWFAIIAAFSADIGNLGGPYDWLLVPLRILTPVATVGLVVAAVWHAWLGWTAKRKWTARVGNILLVLAALVLLWVTIGYNLGGVGLRY